MLVIDFNKKIHEQITEETWCKGTTKWDEHILLANCTILWVSDRYFDSPSFRTEQYERMHATLKIWPGFIGSWNDASERTFADVYNLFKELDL